MNKKAIFSKYIKLPFFFGCFLQRGLLEVLYDIFRLPLPVVAEEFIEALLSVGKYFEPLHTRILSNSSTNLMNPLSFPWIANYISINFFISEFVRYSEVLFKIF